MTHSEPVLTPEAGAELLRIARAAVEAVVHGRPAPETEPALPELAQPLGAFVTLHQKGRLRGCIGRFLPRDPVWQVVAEMARSAAMEDPRFTPVRPEELPDIAIEISVLSPLQKTDDPLALELGTHGIYIRRGGRSGTFLPQVATECKMGKEEFLSTCCAHKAGLPPDAWKAPDTEVFLYTAQIFHERET
jgi:uncharacterized protein